MAEACVLQRGPNARGEKKNQYRFSAREEGSRVEKCFSSARERSGDAEEPTQRWRLGGDMPPHEEGRTSVRLIKRANERKIKDFGYKQLCFEERDGHRQTQTVKALLFC